MKNNPIKKLNFLLIFLVISLPFASAYQMPFGEVLSGGSDCYTFTGQELDMSGLMYYGARYYDPQMGKFTQPDTVIKEIYNPQNLNRYSYVLNNPYKYTDPSGHYECNGYEGCYSYDYGFVNFVAGGSFDEGDTIGNQFGFTTGKNSDIKYSHQWISAIPLIAGSIATSGFSVSPQSNLKSVETINRDPKVKSDFLKTEASKPNVVTQYGDNGVEAMKQGKSPPGFQVHHDQPLYAGGSDTANNLKIVPKGSGPSEHPGMHARGGETYEQFGPPSQYKSQPTQKWWQFLNG